MFEFTAPNVEHITPSATMIPPMGPTSLLTAFAATLHEQSGSEAH